MTFTTKADIIKQNPLGRKDKQSEDIIKHGNRRLAEDNAKQGARNVTVDISGIENENQKANRYININEIPMQYDLLAPADASVKLVYAQNMKQLVIYNPTTTIIKVGKTRVDTASYMFVVNAMKMVVFPPFNFDTLFLFQESIQNSFSPPIVYAYAEVLLAPSISIIT